jgi:hypothetical protein
MGNWLNNPFNETSIIWLLLSALLGGVIGASIKFVFDYLLPENLKSRKELLEIKSKYAVPIFHSAVQLRKRLDNIVKLIKLIEEEDGWLDKDDSDDYYFLSTIYITAQFFGWIQVLRHTVIYLDLSSTSETKAYSYGLDAIISSFSDPALMEEKPATDPQDSEDKWIYSIWLQAIGDQMIKKEDSEYSVLSFAEFCDKLKNTKNKDFHKWMSPLIDFYHDLKSNQIRFRRIAAIHAIVNSFIELNDPKFLRNRKWIYYWNVLLPSEQDKIIELIQTFRPKFKKTAN